MWCTKCCRPSPGSPSRPRDHPSLRRSQHPKAPAARTLPPALCRVQSSNTRCLNRPHPSPRFPNPHPHRNPFAPCAKNPWSSHRRQSHPKCGWSRLRSWRPRWKSRCRCPYPNRRLFLCQLRYLHPSPSLHPFPRRKPNQFPHPYPYLHRLLHRPLLPRLHLRRPPQRPVPRRCRLRPGLLPSHRSSRQRHPRATLPRLPMPVDTARQRR